MATMNFKYTSTPLNANDLDNVELKFGFRFPDELRQLYLAFNGGRPDRSRFKRGEELYIVDLILPVKYAKPPLHTLENDFNALRVEQKLLPDFLVPFAINPGGDYFCFSSREVDYGAIYIFRMDLYKQPARGTIQLAASLDEFLAKLEAKVSNSAA